MFADDTSLFIDVDNRVTEHLEEDLRAISGWAKTWLVTFSPPKTETLIVSNKCHLESHPTIHME